MGQSASSADLKGKCVTSCKDWGEKEYNTVKVDLASIRPLECLNKICNDDCLGNDALKTSQNTDKELVTDQENLPPDGFKMSKLNQSGQEEFQDGASSPVSTVASMTVSAAKDEKESRVPQIVGFPGHGMHQALATGLHESAQDNACENKGMQHSSTQQNGREILMDPKQHLLVEQQAQAHVSQEKDVKVFEISIIRLEWSDSQHCLVRREEIAIPSGNEIYPDLKVADFKILLKDQKMTLKSGEVLHTDHMVLTTPRKLEVGHAMDGLKTLAESGVGTKGSELLLIDTESIQMAYSARSASPRDGPGRDQQILEDKLYYKAKAEKEAQEQAFAEQQMKVRSWLKSNGFKDVNELIRKMQLGLTKTRPLHVAVHKGDAEMIEMLLALGADPQMCNGKNETPLQFAKRIQTEKKGAPGSTTTYFKVVSALSKTQSMMINEGFG